MLLQIPLEQTRHRTPYETNKFVADNFNISSLEFSLNGHVKKYFDISLQSSFVPLINRPKG